ncbi:MAG: hypothetical protein A2X49_08265 [Lentisphaerae bacterium GWF2_52_8]|nr:MAG: hypothetical protein A2X49_08265 [Lentisphaerae bacterium GWF2_52_8]
MRLKVIIWLSFSLLLSSSLCSCVSHSRQTVPAVPKDILDSGQVRVGLASDCPPFAFSKDGEAAGLEKELLEKLAAAIGVKPVFIIMPREELTITLRAGQIDIAAGAFSAPSIDRQSLVSSPKYLAVKHYIAVRKEAAPFIKTVLQLNNKDIEILSLVGSTAAEEVPNLFPEAKHSSVSNFDTAIMELKKKEGVAFVFDEAKLLAREGLKDETDIVVLPEGFQPEKMSFAIRADDSAWQAYLDKWIAGLERNGELKLIINKYLPVRIQD